MQTDIPVRFLAFDLLYQNGHLLLDEPLTKRKARLNVVLANAPSALQGVSWTECETSDEVRLAFARSLAAGHEGIVAKTADSPYKPGRRGGFWLRI